MLKTTEIVEAMVKVKVRKTGKTYRRTMKYAKHVTVQSSLKGPAEHEYYLREDRGWRQVSEEEFKKATSKESERLLHDKLATELRKRIEQEMKGGEKEYV